MLNEATNFYSKFDLTKSYFKSAQRMNEKAISINNKKKFACFVENVRLVGVIVVGG